GWLNGADHKRLRRTDASLLTVVQLSRKYTHMASCQFSIKSLIVRRESYPIRGAFTISRGSKREAAVVVVELSAITADGREMRGRGECVPYARYGETVDGVVAAIEALGADVAAGMDRQSLRFGVPGGAARNAVDCALWDLECKAANLPAWRLANLP